MKNFYIAALLSLAPAKSMAQELMASWYDHGKITANGERYNPDGLTAAHNALPFNTLLWLWYEGRTVMVRVNDRGPFVRGRDIDISRGAAKMLGITGKGVVKLKLLKMRRSYVRNKR